MDNFNAIFLGPTTLKVAVLVMVLTILFLVLMYVLWFFKRPSYKKLWGENHEVRRAVYGYLIVFALSSYFDMLAGFSDHRLYYMISLGFTLSVAYHLSVVCITYLLKKGSEYRKRIPNE